MVIDFSKLNENKKYKTMSNTIFPRPIAWISTEDNGIVNLAPFSYFTPLSSQPPLVIVSIAQKENREPKDTSVNILKHKKCTINFAHSELLENLIHTSEDLHYEVSECEKFGIDMKSILEEYPPMVADAKCALFCDYVKSVDIGSRYEPVLLEIKHIYIEDESIDKNGYIYLENIGRVGTEFLVDAKRVLQS